MGSFALFRPIPGPLKKEGHDCGDSVIVQNHGHTAGHNRDASSFILIICKKILVRLRGFWNQNRKCVLHKNNYVNRQNRMIIQKVSGTIAGILELSKITNILLHTISLFIFLSNPWSAIKAVFFTHWYKLDSNISQISVSAIFSLKFVH